MRALFITGALLILALPGFAHERSRRSAIPMPTPSSIMVEEPASRAERAGRRASGRATSAERRQIRSTRFRPRPVVRTVVPFRGEEQLRGINRSIEAQQQQLRIEQQTQFEANQLRQDLQRGTLGSRAIGSPGCPVGSIAC